MTYDQLKEVRRKFYDNVKTNQMVVVPPDDQMEKALELDMPSIIVIEQPIKPAKKDKRKKIFNQNLASQKGGTIQLFNQMNKSSFQSVTKHGPIDKSPSIQTKKFKAVVASNLEVEAVAYNRKQQQRVMEDMTRNVTAL